jgi:uncharacterized protein (DUF885 family)
VSDKALALNLVLGCALLHGCAAPPGGAASPVSPAAVEAVDSLAEALDDASVGADDAELASLLRDHWAWHLREHPEGATRLGVHAYDDRISDASLAAERARATMRRELLARISELRARSLSERDTMTITLLESGLRSSVATEVCAFERWRVSAQSNPLERFNDLPRLHPWRNASDGATLLARVGAIAAAIDDAVLRLRAGLAQGRVADDESLRRVVRMLDAQLERDVEQWALVEPASRPPPAGWDAAEHAAFGERLFEVVRNEVHPALARYRDFVREELVPAARSDERVGVTSVPDGSECYAALIQQYTTLPLSAQEVHDRGLAEIERIDAQLAALGREALGTKDLSTTLATLRSDPELFFDTAEEIEAAARDALARAQAAIPAWFGRLPKAECVVRRIPDYKAPFTTIAYYQPPHADGSKPGEYFVNVFEPHTRPRYEARVLAFHESIPGHHLQIAIAQELEALPAFRRHGGYTAFVEGWALYTERLADEMELYDTDLDRLGMLSFDAWRAARLVVDTGIHALGWSRGRAEQFMLEHTALAPNNISNEVDRYIGWPGQALAYKTGQLEILRLRQDAEAALGDTFDISAFHDTVLQAGAITLPLLTSRVQAWVASRPPK